MPVFRSPLRFLSFSLPQNALGWEYAGHYPLVQCRPRFVRRVPIHSSRAEGITERVSDILLTCSGGTPTPAGQTIPRTTFQVTLSTNTQLVGGSTRKRFRSHAYD